MKKTLLVASGLLFTTLVATAAAQAQVTLDVSKITCNQFVLQKIASTQSVAIWINGYHSGMRGNTIVDTQGLLESAKKLEDYCFKYPTVTVMQAVDTLFGTSK